MKAQEESQKIREIRRVTWMGLGVNLLISGLKFVGGIIGESQAVVADAVHSLSDISTDAAILLGVRYWSKPADPEHPHGHGHVETLITISIGVVMIVVAGGIMWNALVTMEEYHENGPGLTALFAAIISIVLKEVIYRWTVSVGRRIKSMSLVANAWHHRSDALSSVPVVIAVAAASIFPAWTSLDHFGAIIVSFFILHAAYKIIRPTMGKLIDAGAPKEDLDQIHAIIRDTQGVLGAHNLRTRYLGCSGLAVDLHIEVDPDMSVRQAHDISVDLQKKLIQEGPDVADVMVHIEPVTSSET